MKKIDIENWNRKVPYQNFISYSNPNFSLGTRLDVTKLYDYCKRNRRSFFIEFLFIVSKVLNEIEEFRLRILNGEVVQYDVVDPSFIVMCDDGAIAPCKVEMDFDRESFYQTVEVAKEKRKKQGNEKEFNPKSKNDLFYVSCVPWADICQATNPYNIPDEDVSSIPRIIWAKHVNENDRMKMFFNIEVHHALLDGEPVCRAFNLIQKYLDQVK